MPRFQVNLASVVVVEADDEMAAVANAKEDPSAMNFFHIGVQRLVDPVDAHIEAMRLTAERDALIRQQAAEQLAAEEGISVE